MLASDVCHDVWMSTTYIRQHYRVPAEVGVRISYYGDPDGVRRGVIVPGSTHHLAVQFDDAPTGVISWLHPTWEVEYEGWD